MDSLFEKYLSHQTKIISFHRKRFRVFKQYYLKIVYLCSDNDDTYFWKYTQQTKCVIVFLVHITVRQKMHFIYPASSQFTLYDTPFCVRYVLEILPETCQHNYISFLKNWWFCLYIINILCYNQVSFETF